LQKNPDIQPVIEKAGLEDIDRHVDLKRGCGRLLMAPDQE
jgi:hypothetical protein